MHPLSLSYRRQLGIDYSVLRDKLAAGEWELADNETRRLLIEMAGEEAQLREWVYFSEAKFIPVKDMLTVDRLWRAYSRDRFGWSVQRALWIASKRLWGPFFKRINWVQGENNAYRKWPNEFNYSATAEKGHLPLTNALRGTQLFQAVMEHEAFGGPVVKVEKIVSALPPHPQLHASCSRLRSLLEEHVSHERSNDDSCDSLSQVWGTGDRKSWLSGGGVSAYSGEPPTLGLGLVVQLGALILLAAISSQLFAPSF